MKKISARKLAIIRKMLSEGASLRTTARAANVSVSTVHAISVREREAKAAAEAAAEAEREDRERTERTAEETESTISQYFGNDVLPADLGPDVIVGSGGDVVSTATDFFQTEEDRERADMEKRLAERQRSRGAYNIESGPRDLSGRLLGRRLPAPPVAGAMPVRPGRGRDHGAHGILWWDRE